MIVLDTTVLVYAKGAEHPLREPCRTLVTAISNHQIEATTTAEVIQEFVHVRARRRGRSDAAALGLEYVDLLGPLVPVSVSDLRAGLVLFASIDELGAFDSVLAAATKSANADTLVSADRAFSQVSGIEHVFPDARGVSTLLGR